MKPYLVSAILVWGAAATGPALAQCTVCDAGIPPLGGFVSTSRWEFVTGNFSFQYEIMFGPPPCTCFAQALYPPWYAVAPWAVPPWQEPFVFQQPIIQQPIIQQPILQQPIIQRPIIQQPLIVVPAPQPVDRARRPLPNVQPVPEVQRLPNDPAQANPPPGQMRGFGELADEEQPPQGRGTSAQAVRRAGEFIRQGDQLFAQQKYAVALSRYKTAGQVSPKLAEVWLRQGVAQAALGKYDLAAKALRRAVMLNPRLPQLGFTLEQLYRDNRLAKAAHLDALAQRAIDQPHDGEVFFVLGVFLHFDGQPERAQKFFQRAGELTLGDRRHVAAFVAEVERQAARDQGALGREL